MNLMQLAVLYKIQNKSGMCQVDDLYKHLNMMDLMQLTIGHHGRCRTLTDWTEINRINYNICEYDNGLVHLTIDQVSLQYIRITYILHRCCQWIMVNYKTVTHAGKKYLDKACAVSNFLSCVNPLRQCQ